MRCILLATVASICAHACSNLAGDLCNILSEAGYCSVIARCNPYEYQCIHFCRLSCNDCSTDYGIPTTTRIQSASSTTTTTTNSKHFLSTSTSGTTDATPSPTSLDYKILSRHNTMRSRHGAPLLMWNSDLAAHAKQVVSACQFTHSKSSYGENLYASTPSNMFNPENAVEAWYDEIKDYSFSEPVFSTKTGHFTQVVWKSTREIGCALQTCSSLSPMNLADASFLACEYFPPGNVLGQFSKNVEEKHK